MIELPVGRLLMRFIRLGFHRYNCLGNGGSSAGGDYVYQYRMAYVRGHPILIYQGILEPPPWG